MIGCNDVKMVEIKLLFDDVLDGRLQCCNFKTEEQLDIHSSNQQNCPMAIFKYSVHYIASCNNEKGKRHLLIQIFWRV